MEPSSGNWQDDRNVAVNVSARIARHVRLTQRAARHQERQTPPFMIVFINSICNLTCEHCFYWRNLNQRDDLTFEEFKKLSLELGKIEILNLSGGEPFIRPDFAEICLLFTENNGAHQIYVPTNGYFTERTEKQLRGVLKSKTLQRFVCEISLDGMPIGFAAIPSLLKKRWRRSTCWPGSRRKIPA